jgi:AcrR family transcriptional regulator
MNDKRSKRKVKDRMLDGKTEKIITSAEALFLANGLRGTTMEAIARAAGVAKPTLYGRFPDKESVFRAVVGRLFDRLKQQFTEALAGPGPAPERIARALAAKYAAIYGMLRQSPHAAEILEANETLANGENAALYDWTLGEVTRCLTEAGMADAAARAALVIAATEGLRSRAIGSERLAGDVEFVVTRLLS